MLLSITWHNSKHSSEPLNSASLLSNINTHRCRNVTVYSNNRRKAAEWSGEIFIIKVETTISVSALLLYHIKVSTVLSCDPAVAYGAQLACELIVYESVDDQKAQPGHRGSATRRGLPMPCSVRWMLVRCQPQAPLQAALWGPGWQPTQEYYN